MIVEQLLRVAIDNDVHVICDVQMTRDKGLAQHTGLEGIGLSDWWARYA